jgi:glycosyltransferase involved in cell wall biosynthesis
MLHRPVKQSSPCPTLSVVLAVRESEETIGRDVRVMAQHLRAAGVSFEILAVNDGCCDNSLAVLRLLEAQVPELRICAGDARGRAFVRGAAEAMGHLVALVEPGDGSLPLSTLGWAASRLERSTHAVVFRGRCVVARRLPCLPAIIRSRGRGDVFERSFERAAHGLAIDVVGTRPRMPTGLLAPVLRFLAA